MTHYTLDLVLAPDFAQLTGAATIRYTNRETVTLDALYLHLYPNLWDGGMAIADVRRSGVPAAWSLTSGDDLAEVRLAPPLQPGQTTELALVFSVPIPADGAVGNYGEFAYRQEILALAHFYPTVAVYDTGWRLETPAAQGDVIYHDASVYDVTFTASAELTLAATGATLARGDGPAGQATWRLTGGPLRDFNIVASRRFRVASAQMDDVTVNSYYLPDAAEGGRLALQWSVDALRALEAEVGAYPYAELDVTATATDAGGIEYPGLIVIAERLYSDPGQRATLQSVALHEVAHEWWYAVIGNDQLNHPWLDEALAQYGVYLYLRRQYGAAGEQGFIEQMKLRWARANSIEKVIGLPVRAYEGHEYGAVVYGRGPLFVLALQDRIGERAMARFMRRYYAEYAWGIAAPADFRRLAEEEGGQGLGDLFAQWVDPR
jgi:aminopeptidase N